ncbi:MAG: T9SS type A sorting domain-containing protein [Bacteroidetes bacterium]|nr:T9SS type A sorting domain-containing protein [Bacteroidota bacterium]
MKLRFFVLFFFFTLYSAVSAQTFSVTVDNVSVNGDVGDELVVHMTMKNITSSDLVLYMVRSINDQPLEWSSTFCFTFCYPPTLDSLVTEPVFSSSPLAAGEERILEFHVFALTTGGTGNYQIKIGDSRSGQIEVINLVATTETTGFENATLLPNGFSLEQNYPNPFNPTTSISYSLTEAGYVSFAVFDALGKEVKAISEGYRNTGSYKLHFDGNDLSSGIYIYQLSVNNKILSKKMLLEK